MPDTPQTVPDKVTNNDIVQPSISIQSMVGQFGTTEESSPAPETGQVFPRGKQPTG